MKIDGNKIDIAGLEDPLRLAVGEHGLEVTSGEFKSVTQFFTVHRGEQEVVRITLEPTPKTTGPSDRCDLVFDGSGDYIATPFSYGGHSPITVEAVITPYREKGAGCPVGNYQGSGVGLSVGSDGLAHFLFHDSRAYKSAVSDRQVVPFRRGASGRSLRRKASAVVRRRPVAEIHIGDRGSRARSASIRS